MQQRSLFSSPEPQPQPKKEEPVASPPIFSVTEITSEIKFLLEANYSSVWVEGEISNFNQPATSGHFYFNLKDSSAQIRCVMWKSSHRFLRWRPKEGMKVIVNGKLTVYEGRGEYQIDVRQMSPHGKGDLYAAFEQLKERLQNEGLFDQKRKRPIPMLPKKIGVVTSPTGAVIRDMLHILNRRYMNLQIVIFPAKVQGDDAAATIVEGIQVLNRTQDIDVLIVARGGGSIEDLWPFNEEVVARAIVASRIPVISAVGHETDTTIADFVADFRAPTPSAAAEQVIGKKSEFVERVLNLSGRLDSVLRTRVLRFKNQIHLLAQDRALSGVPQRVHAFQQRLDDCATRLQTGLNRYHQTQTRRLLQAQNLLHAGQLKHLIEVKRSKLNQSLERLRAVLNRNYSGCAKSFMQVRSKLHADQLRRLIQLDSSKLNQEMDRLRRNLDVQVGAGQKALVRAVGMLDSLSPLAVLERGYSIAFDEHENTLKESTQVSPGQKIRVRLHRGKLKCEVQEIDHE
jgi:exodeoxyribonuclease VII large subunit